MSVNRGSDTVSQEAMLLDQALDAVNQRLTGPPPVPARALENRSGFARLISRARDRGVDFQAEYQRIQAEAPPAAAAQVPESPTPPKPPPPPPAAAPDSTLETTRLFLQFLEKREKHLFELVRTVVAQNRQLAPADPSADAHQPRFPRSVS
jgi:hypothetical protein